MDEVRHKTSSGDWPSAGNRKEHGRPKEPRVLEGSRSKNLVSGFGEKSLCVVMILVIVGEST